MVPDFFWYLRDTGWIDDEAYVKRHMKDFRALERFVGPYTPEWAEAETGIEASHKQGQRQVQQNFVERRPVEANGKSELSLLDSSPTSLLLHLH